MHKGNRQSKCIFFLSNTMDVSKTQDQQKSKRHWKSPHITLGSLDAWVKKLDSWGFFKQSISFPLQSDSQKKPDLGILNHPLQDPNISPWQWMQPRENSFLTWPPHLDTYDYSLISPRHWKMPYSYYWSQALIKAPTFPFFLNTSRTWVRWKIKHSHHLLLYVNAI